jgi:hypothetical protein
MSGTDSLIISNDSFVVPQLPLQARRVEEACWASSWGADLSFAAMPDRKIIECMT